MKDFKLNSEESFVFTNGDFTISNDEHTDRQNIYDILTHSKGHYRLVSNLGCNLKDNLNGPKDVDYVTNVIKQQLFHDNFKIYDIIIDENTSLDEFDIVVNARHKN